MAQDKKRPVLEARQKLTSDTWGGGLWRAIRREGGNEGGAKSREDRQQNLSFLKGGECNCKKQGV